MPTTNPLTDLLGEELVKLLDQVGEELQQLLGGVPLGVRKLSPSAQSARRKRDAEHLGQLLVSIGPVMAQQVLAASYEALVAQYGEDVVRRAEAIANEGFREQLGHDGVDEYLPEGED